MGDFFYKKMGDFFYKKLPDSTSLTCETRTWILDFQCVLQKWKMSWANMLEVNCHWQTLQLRDWWFYKRKKRKREQSATTVTMKQGKKIRAHSAGSCWNRGGENLKELSSQTKPVEKKLRSQLFVQTTDFTQQISVQKHKHRLI